MSLSAAQKAATKRWTRSKADQMAVANGCWFDTKAATRVITFFKTFLRHSKGQWAGQPFVPLKWQDEDILRPLFGWKRPDGTRRYRIAYIEIPKKNGKSTLCAGLSLYGLIGDDEPGAEVYSAAASRDQASIVYKEAASMVRKSPALSSKIALQESVKHMAFLQTESWYKALSADVGTNEGMNIHFLIMDEMHAQKNDGFWNALMYGGAARRQPLQVIITTAGVDRDSLCFDYHTKAMQVMEGTLQDDAFFAYVRSAEWALQREKDAATKGQLWKQEAVWREANPSLGQTIGFDGFKEDFLKAEQSPRLENAFKRYRLNLWTEQEERWLPLDHWQACAGEINVNQLLGKRCYAGLDLASVSDLCAFILWFPDDGNRILPFFWIPEETVKKLLEKGDSSYHLWVQQGFLQSTEGNIVDYDIIYRDIVELSERYHIAELAYDRWNATQLITQLGGQGIECVGFGQGFASMSAPSKEFEKLILAHQLLHNGHPVLTWNVSNVALQSDAAGNIKPSKALSQKRKIDGVVASIMALGRAMVREKEATSIYETPGALRL